ncbi:MAG: dihydrofolate reductase family protein [Saprospiraceae bacterium]|jgi:dihydrofolate reductase|nr:dihydrofolate reductase [Saprospiraceae bacterium]HMS69504.1 dihydrofolate reductase family protein [Saprospiraceae bacterium]
MTLDQFKLTIHMVSSLDGFIAKKDNSISWFETSHSYDKGVDGEDPVEFLKTIDCYVMGYYTYELALLLSKDYGWAYGDKPTVVLTTRPLQSDRKNLTFYSGNLNTLIIDRLKPNFNNVWVVGGSKLTKGFLAQKLVDEIRVSILPIILGEGLAFFDQIGQEHLLILKDAKAYKNGIVELCYDVKK